MTMTPRQETAKIYQFPVKGRLTPPESRKPRQSEVTHPVVASDFGSGWYHDAAMQDADRGRKH